MKLLIWGNGFLCGIIVGVSIYGVRTVLVISSLLIVGVIVGMILHKVYSDER